MGKTIVFQTAIFLLVTPYWLTAQMFMGALTNKNERRAISNAKKALTTFKIDNCSGTLVLDTADSKKIKRLIRRNNRNCIVDAKYSYVVNAFDSLNNIDYDNFYLSAGGNGGLVLAPLTIGHRVRVSKHNLGFRGRVIDPVWIFAEYKTALASTYDSLDIRKTYMFPEISRNTFILGVTEDLTPTNQNFYAAWQIEGHVSKTRNDKKTDFFESYGYTYGLRFEWRDIVRRDTGNPPNNGWIMLYIYRNSMRVDPKYSVQYHTILGEPNLPEILELVGATFAIGTQNSGLFINAKYFMPPNRGRLNPEFKTWVWTVGYRIYFSKGLLQLRP